MYRVNKYKCVSFDIFAANKLTSIITVSTLKKVIFN